MDDFRQHEINNDNFFRCIKMEEDAQRLEAAYALVVNARTENLCEISTGGC